MTVATTTARNDYLASAGQTLFPYTFQIFADSDVQVFKGATLLNLIADYTVTNAGVATGGNVVLTSGAAASDAIHIVRRLTLTQGLDLTELGAFPAETTERALDRLTYIAQGLDEVDQRTLKFPASSTSTGKTVDDLVVGKYARVKADGSGIEWADLVLAGAIGIPVPVSQGGTNATTALGARQSLGLDGVVVKQLTNSSGGSVVAGDVLTVSGATAILGNTVSSKQKYVVALASIGSGAVGDFAASGIGLTVRVAGATTAGNYLRKSTTTLALEDTTTAANSSNDPPAGSCAIAQTGSGGAGTVTAIVFDQTYPGTPTASLPVLGGFVNLRAFTDPDDPAERMRVLADRAILVDSAGLPKVFAAVDVVADLGTAGANGIDTGAKANDTGYDLYVIGKPDGTVGALWSKGLQWVIDQTYADGNRDAVLGLKDASARTQLAQGFQVAATGKLHSIDVSILRVGTPTGSLWAEVQTNSAGVPSGTMVTGGRGILVPVDALDATTRVRMRLVFPERPALTSGTQYHLVLKGEWAVSGANFVNVGVDASSPSYANGAMSVFDGASWTADATRDMALFIVNTLTGAEAPYANLPAGYTYAARASWNRTNGSGAILRIRQNGPRWDHLVRQDAGALSGTSLWTAQDLNTILPPAWAATYDVVVAGNGNGFHAFVADGLPSGSPASAGGTPQPGQIGAAPGSGHSAVPVTLPADVGPMVWTTVNTAGRLFTRGATLAL